MDGQQNGQPETEGSGGVPEPSSEDHKEDAPAPEDRRRRRLWLRAGLAAAGVAVAAVALTVALSRSGAPPVVPSRTPSPSPTPPFTRTGFEFDLASVTWTSYTGREAPGQARKAAEQVRVTLSKWYDAAFLDPAEWENGPPDSAWALFAKKVTKRARTRDTRSLSLGKVDGLQALEAGKTRLTVRVLLDPSLRGIAAVATVRFDASGTLSNGDLLSVKNSSTFLLRPVGKAWRIVAYPKASTKVNERPAPSPSPSITVSGSASATPSATGSPTT